MTEYDYSEDGRRRFMATQQRIAKWAQSAPTPADPFTPRTIVPTARPSQFGPAASGAGPGSRASTARAPPMHLSRRFGSSTHHTVRSSRAPSMQSHSRSPSMQSHSRSPSHAYTHTHTARAPSVSPSESISQAGARSPSVRTQQSRGPSHFSGAGSSHTTHTVHHHHRPTTYIISAPPSPAPARSQGVIILPRRGKAPKVVYY
ncbi:hypothetical protein GGX14DRAFT_480414 [Mycena pura]|uniref:Uncharacterized protein n=1 Tax=Mycena pura TaxID=153505 RepID=A0AAD6XXY0_9AGAR|nr:hypothetical protein GGX14DRAFT_480414 [Mycena pura]